MQSMYPISNPKKLACFTFLQKTSLLLITSNNKIKHPADIKKKKLALPFSQKLHYFSSQVKNIASNRYIKQAKRGGQINIQRGKSYTINSTYLPPN
jgi:ABC-type taurine transport system substrate-binding protein